MVTITQIERKCAGSKKVWRTDHFGLALTEGVRLRMAAYPSGASE